MKVEGICLFYVETDGLHSTKTWWLFTVYGSCWNKALKMVFSSNNQLNDQNTFWESEDLQR